MTHDMTSPDPGRVRVEGVPVAPGPAGGDRLRAPGTPGPWWGRGRRGQSQSRGEAAPG